MLTNVDVVIPDGMAFLRKNNFLYFFFVYLLLILKFLLKSHIKEIK